MKTYQYTRNPGVIYDQETDTWFPTEETHPAYIKMQAEIAAGTARLLAFVEPQPAEKRSAAYLARGVTTDAMIIALWEKVMESDSSAADDLQATRLQVKTDFPNNV